MANGQQRADPSASPTEPEDQAATSSDAPQSKPSLTEAKPPIFWLPDAHGNLIPILGHSLEDFRRLLDLQKGLQPNEGISAFTPEELKINGTVGRDRAELTIQLEVRLHTDHWVKIPLHMGEITLRARAEYDGPGESVVAVDPGGNGYIWQLRGSAERPHRLSLSAMVPVERVGAQRHLKITLPRTASSRLALRVPELRAEARASDGAALDVTADTRGSMLTVYGTGGPLEVWWREAGEQTPEMPTALEATGAILVRIDSRNVSTVATLRVKSHSAPLSRFRVRLPRGAVLISGTGPGYVAEIVGANPSQAASLDVAPVVEVQLDEETREVAEIRLVTEQALDPTRTDVMVEMAGFEVLEAVRQSGHIAAGVLGDWQMVWGPRRSVRQIAVADLPSELQSEEIVAGFEYLNQPCSLMGRITPRRSRIAVEPEYVFQIEANRLVLDARLKYTVRGARVFALELDLPRPRILGRRLPDALPDERLELDALAGGWEIEALGPADQVDLTGTVLEEVSPLSIPLLQPTIGQMELHLRATYPIPSGAAVISFELPRPAARTVGAAAVVLAPADNVELAPRLDEMRGLSRQPAKTLASLPARQQPPLVYRGDLPDARFVGDFEIRKRRIDVDVNSTVRFEQDAVRVEQLLHYEIAHEPLEMVVLELPRSLADSNALEIRLADEVLSAPESRASADDDGETLRLTMALPGEHIGTLTLAIKYVLPIGPLAAEEPAAVEIPLVMPADGTLRNNDLRLVTAAGLTVEFRDEEEDWSESAVESETGDGSTQRRFAAVERTRALRLDAMVEDPRVLDATLVDRVWIQTVLSSGQRQDRVVYRLTSSERQLFVRPPRGAAMATIRLRLDDREVAPRRRRDDTLVIPLSDGGQNRPHVLEIRYEFSDPRPGGGAMSFEPPRLLGSVFVRRTYWQLVLPRDEHLVSQPDGYTPEFVWGWEGSYWGRQPFLNQFELENWVTGDLPLGVLHRPAPSARTNRYLFSTLGAADRLEVRSAARSLIVLAASGTALVAGLLLLYVPWTRRRGVLLVTLVVLLSLGAIYPEPIVLVAQAASLGLILSLLAGFLRRSVSRPRRGATVANARSSSIYDRTLPVPSGGPGKPGSTRSEQVDLEFSARPSPDA